MPESDDDDDDDKCEAAARTDETHTPRERVRPDIFDGHIRRFDAVGDLIVRTSRSV